jgi:acetylornithine deacetylase
MSISASHGRDVQRYIAAREHEIVELLTDLVRIPSVSGSLAQNDCQDMVAAALRDTHHVEIDEWCPDWERVAEIRTPDGDELYVPLEARPGFDPAVYGALRCLVATSGTAGPHLVLGGHVDVVPAGEGWTGEAFVPTRSGDRLIGRGTMDMKGGLVAAIFAFKALADLGLLETGRVSLASVPEEENGGNGTLAVIEHGVVGNAWVFAEPTDLQVVHRHHGIQAFEITVRGRPGGILRRSWGHSANTDLGSILVSAAELEKTRTENEHTRGGYEADDLPGFVNVGFIRGGEWLATRADHASASGLMGVLPTENLAQARAALISAAEGSVARSEDVTVSFPPGGHRGGELARTHVLCRAFARAAAALGASDIRLSRAGTMVCDAKIVHGGGFAPAVVCGPVGTGLHARDESVDVPSVLRCAELLAMAALEFTHLAGQRTAGGEIPEFDA